MPKYAPLTADDLRERVKEIEIRIKQMEQRDRSLADLRAWLMERELGVLDLLWMYRQLKKPVRAAAPVKSRKPIKPQPRANGSNGHDPVITRMTMTHKGRTVQRKGDPKFRAAI